LEVAAQPFPFFYFFKNNNNNNNFSLIYLYLFIQSDTRHHIIGADVAPNRIC